MGRGVRTEVGVIPERRGAGVLVRPADVLAHQQLGDAEILLIREAEAQGVTGWEITGPGSCRELHPGSAIDVGLDGLPLAVALEAWCSERLDFDHLMGALVSSQPLLSESAYAAFPELRELL